jgi:hypothetical protein
MTIYKTLTTESNSPNRWRKEGNALKNVWTQKHLIPISSENADSNLLPTKLCSTYNDPISQSQTIILLDSRAMLETKKIKKLTQKKFITFFLTLLLHRPTT